jgi:UV DNA damage endonuclease
MHADILDYMGIDKPDINGEVIYNGVIIVHGGGVFGNKEETITRWIHQFKLLPQNVRNRLVVEHCEYCYSPDDVLKISHGCEIPVVFDTHHYSCYQQIHPKEHITPINELLHQIVKTWGKRTPLFHISQQGSGRIGHHSDYITEIPKYLLDFLSEYKSDNKHFKINLEVEAKMKELAIMKLYKIYPQIFEQKMIIS